MYFYTFFHLHVFSQKFLNNNFQFLNICTKRTHRGRCVGPCVRFFLINHLVCVWVRRLHLCLRFFCFVLFFSRILGQILLLRLLFIHCAWIVVTKFDLSNNFQPISAHHVPFTDPQISLFSNFFIKNGSHGTIHTFKNYFAIMFFSFQLYLNGLGLLLSWIHHQVQAHPLVFL